MRSFLGFLVMKYKNSSFQNKLFYSYFILIFVPLIILSYFSYNQSAGVITAQSKNIASLYLNQTEGLLKSEFLKMATIAQIISQDSEIRNVLENSDSSLTFSQEYDEMGKLYKEVTRIQGLYEVDRIRLYISQNFRFSRANEVTYSMAEIEEKEWYKWMVENRLSTMILPPYSFRMPMASSFSQISIVTLIHSRGDFNKILGAVFVDMSEDKLAGYLETASYTKNTSAYIIDGTGNIICRTGNTELLTPQKLKGLLSELLKASKEHTLLTTDNAVIGISGEVYGDWRIISAVSFRDILDQSSKLKWQLIIFSALIGILAYVIAYLYARYSSKRLKHLSQQIKQAEQGNFSIACIVDSEDDIGELQNSFNFMVRRINTLLQEQYELGQNLQKLEMKVLQAQINPHFLYNTLDLVSWKAKKCGNGEIEDIVLKLARFYQISLSNGNDFIPLKNEFEHIRLYVALQNMRLKNEIDLQLELEPEIAEVPVIKLLLQPLVENSIIHGILNMEEQQGIISVRAERSNEYIRIVITDNGAGIGKSKLLTIQSHENYHAPSHQQGGFGLINVIDRLKAHYGKNCTFNIVSAPFHGTEITICIPDSSHFSNIS